MRENRKLIPDLLFFQEGPGVRNTQYTASGVKLLNVANLVDGTVDLSTSERYISEEEAYGKYSHFMVEEGDFIIASSGIKVEYFDKKMGFIEKKHLPLCMNTSTIRFKTLDKNILNIRYFMYFFKSNDFKMQLHKQITGSAQLNFGPTHLKRMTVPIIEISKQKNIVKTLDILSSIIKERNQQLSYYDDLVKSRFVEMFGDPVENTMNWKICKLGDLSVQINSGNTPKGGEQVYVDKGITFFRSQNVWKDRLVMDDIAFIDKETHENMKRSSLKHGDILMTKTGRINTENSSLGRAALYLGENDAANVNGHVYFIRIKPDVNNEFILKILVSNEYLGYIRSVCVGGIDKRQLNKNHIEDFPIICPPKDMQNNFIDFVHQVDKLKFDVGRSLKEAHILFDSLMQKYFG